MVEEDLSDESVVPRGTSLKTHRVPTEETTRRWILIVSVLLWLAALTAQIVLPLSLSSQDWLAIAGVIGVAGQFVGTILGAGVAFYFRP